MDKPDWQQLTVDVNTRIAMLKACWTSTAADSLELHDKLAQDIYIPALRLLADFCATVEIGGEDDT